MLNQANLLVALFLLPANLLAQTTFTKITAGAIVNDGGVSKGISWSDYNNDGYLDLFVANSGENNFLYQNNGDGTFTSVTEGPIVNDLGSSSSSSWGDYDNDGDHDLFVANFGENNFLYQNNGDGTFDGITVGDIVKDGGNSGGASWGDYDNDGDLDLVVANNGLNFLYQNNGDSERAGAVTFTLITSGPIFNSNTISSACNWGDYDNDGDLDLFIANAGSNLLYDNNGSGLFTQIQTGEIASDSGNSNSANWIDYDNDGDLDLFVLNNQEKDLLYQNNGAGAFTRITEGAIVNTVGVSFGSIWGDYDNDGDLDLFVANGGLSRGNNILYENQGDGTFTRITSGEIVNDGGDSGGCAWGDYDNDGDLDLYVTNASSENNFLYQNNGTGNNWINIKCVGTFSNTSAIGAKVRTTATLGGKVVRQLREISAQTGAGGHNNLNAHFGLRDATVIDSIQIAWPSGRNQLLTNVSVNQFLSVIEPILLVLQDIPSAESGADLVVVATDTSGFVSQVSLRYRSGGETAFTTVAMSDQGEGTFRGTIPASGVTTSGLEYRLVATDDAGRTARLPLKGSYHVQVHVAGGVSTGQAQPHGSAQTAYRIFSVPLDLEDKRPAALLVDDLGEYDVTRWRFAEYLPNNTYREFPEMSAIESGKGYWFAVSEPARVIDTGAGTSVTTANEFEINLFSGWNLVGNPFDFPIPVENLRLASGNPVVLRTYTGAWNDPVGSPVSQLVPFEGYAIFNELAGSDVLFINPDLSSAGVAKASTLNNDLSFLRMQESPSPVQPGRETPQEFTPAKAGAGVTGMGGIKWSLRIIAQCQDARDVDNVVGASPFASDGWDPLDFPEPPLVGEYVSVYFPRQEWGKLSKRFCTDFRPTEPPAGSEPAGGFSGHVWEFEVKSNIRDRVHLTFEGLETVPGHFEVWLVDERLNLIQNLRERNEFLLTAPGEKQPKRLKLLVGKSEFLREELASVQTVPDDFELSQNFPNPFNPVTTIRFGLPRVETVTLKVYNVLGELVATLLDTELKSAGYHAAIWDGRNRQGRQVASGVYVSQLVAGDSRLTRKMALVR